MKYIKQMVIILLILSLGNFISSLTKNIIIIPGSIIAMILLFTLLCFKIVKLDDVEDTANFFLKILALFFIPSGIKIITMFDIIAPNILEILFIGIIVTILTMAATMKFVDVLALGGKKDE